MIILIRLLVIVSAFLVFLSPILTICTSLKATILIQSFSTLLLLNYLVHCIERKNKRYEKNTLNIILIILTFIVYKYFNIIGLSYIFGLYGSVLVLIPLYIFSKHNRMFISNDKRAKIFNVIWASLIINFVVYPYMKLNFIKIENNGSIPVISFIDCSKNLVIISILYVCILLIQILIDRKSINIKKYMDDIIFYQYCIGILIILIPTIHLIYLGVL